MSRNELVRWSLPRQDLRRVAQKKVVNMLLDSFEAKLTTEKWAKLIKSSHDTALRDIQDLIAKGILKQEEAGGRRTPHCLFPTGNHPQSQLAPARAQGA